MTTPTGKLGYVEEFPNSKSVWVGEVNVRAEPCRENRCKVAGQSGKRLFGYTLQILKSDLR